MQTGQTQNALITVGVSGLAAGAYLHSLARKFVDYFWPKVCESQRLALEIADLRKQLKEYPVVHSGGGGVPVLEARNQPQRAHRRGEFHLER